jgi:hypothetical protein
MRLIPSYIMLGGLLVSVAACDRPANTDDRRTQEEKTDQAAHRAGEDAYKAAEKAKELARQAAEEVKKAGKEAHDGWEDAKHSDPDTDAQRTHEKDR